eukprot:scaffold51380_cov34-Cyclotella_meneghiniana.AAC.4
MSQDICILEEVNDVTKTNSMWSNGVFSSYPYIILTSGATIPINQFHGLYPSAAVMPRNANANVNTSLCLGPVMYFKLDTASDGKKVHQKDALEQTVCPVRAKSLMGYI